MPRSRRQQGKAAHSRSHVSAALVVVVLGAAPTGVAAAFGPEADLPSDVIGSGDPALATVPVQETIMDRERAVQLRLTWGKGYPVISAGGAGTVTAVNLQEGDQVKTGTRLFDVDDRTVFAVVSDRPLYRDLRWGDTGPDVAAAAALLRALGYLDGDGSTDDVLGPRAASAIVRFNRDFGWGNDAVFRREATAWSPRTVTVATIHASPGHGAPPPGDPVVEGSPLLQDAELVTASGDPLRIDPEERRLVVGKATIPIAPTRQNPLDTKGLVALSKAVPTDVETYAGRLRGGDPLPVVVVPVSALIPDVQDEDQWCVAAPGEAHGRTVTVIGSEYGQALLSPSADLPAQVLARPQDAGVTSCRA